MNGAGLRSNVDASELADVAYFDETNFTTLVQYSCRCRPICSNNRNERSCCLPRGEECIVGAIIVIEISVIMSGTNCHAVIDGSSRSDDGTIELLVESINQERPERQNTHDTDEHCGNEQEPCNCHREATTQGPGCSGSRGHYSAGLIM
jgi:hypothetical protein